MPGRSRARASRISRAFSVRSASELVLALLARAEVQQFEGIAPLRNIHTGIPTFDDAVPSWWGLTLLVGEPRIGKTVLAARIALETARAGEDVLWLCARGNSEGAVFRLLTGIARIRVRAVFVERTLSATDWKALATAADELSALPLRLVDVHGATIGELAAVTRAAARAARPPEFVVLDGVAGLERSVLSALESYAEELGIPVLVIATTDADTMTRLSVGAAEPDLPLRPGSLLLALRARDATSPPESATHRLLLELRRVRDPFARSIDLDMECSCRWLEERRGER